METKYEDHPVSKIYPMMDGGQLQELAADIKEHGLLEPVVLYAGKILDGRNRFRACKLAGVSTRFDTYSGDSPAAFVVSMNAKRRHLTASQKAAAAALAEPHFAEEAKERQRLSQGRGKKGSVKLPYLKGKASEQAAKALGVSGRYVSQAKKLKTEQPEIFKQVHAGERTLQEGQREVSAREFGADTPTKIDESKLNNDSYNLQQLKYYWQRASKKDKKAFKTQIKLGD